MDSQLGEIKVWGKQPTIQLLTCPCADSLTACGICETHWQLAYMVRLSMLDSHAL